MINLIPNVYQSAFMANLGRGAIIKQVEKSKTLFGLELQKKSAQIYRKGFEEGEKSNVLGKEGSAYTAYLYIDSTGETKPNAFPTTLQLLDFIEVKGFAKLSKPVRYWQYIRRTRMPSKIYFDREKFLNDRYDEKGNGNTDHYTFMLKALGTEKTATKDEEIIYTTYERTKKDGNKEMQTLDKINEPYLNYLFDQQSVTNHPNDENIKVKHIELRKLDIMGDKLDIYKFMDYKDGKAFGEYKVEPLAETLGTYEELLQEAVQTFTNVFNIESLEKSMTRDYDKKKLGSKKGLKSDINYENEYKRLAYYGGKTNKEQVLFLENALSKAKNSFETEGIKAVIRLLNNDKKIIKNGKGNYQPEEEEGVPLTEKENREHVEDEIINAGIKENYKQLKFIESLIKKYNRSRNINKGVWIKYAKELKGILMMAKKQYFYNNDITGFTLTDPPIDKPIFSTSIEGLKKLPKASDLFKTPIIENKEDIIEEKQPTNVLNPQPTDKPKEEKKLFVLVYKEDANSGPFNSYLIDNLIKDQPLNTRKEMEFFNYATSHLENYASTSPTKRDAYNTWIVLNNFDKSYGLEITLRDPPTYDEPYSIPNYSASIRFRSFSKNKDDIIVHCKLVRESDAIENYEEYNKKVANYIIKSEKPKTKNDTAKEIIIALLENIEFANSIGGIQGAYYKRLKQMNGF